MPLRMHKPITGILAAANSAMGQHLGECVAEGVHLRDNTCRRMVVSERVLLHAD